MKITILFLLTSLSAFSQCDYFIHKKDDFSGLMNIETNEVKIAETAVSDYSEPYFCFYMNLLRKDDVNFIVFRFTTSEYCIANSSAVKLKLENGKIFTITNSSGIHCGYAQRFIGMLPADVAAQLQESPIVNVRFSIDSGDVDATRIVEPRFFINNLQCLK